MTCWGVEVCAGNKAKQNRCQTSWHFYSGNSNLGWQNEMNPPPHHHQAVCRQAAPPGWLHTAPPPALTSWQPVLTTTTRTVPLLARCLRSSRWPDGKQAKYTAASAVRNIVKVFKNENTKKNKKKKPFDVNVVAASERNKLWYTRPLKQDKTDIL